MTCRLEYWRADNAWAAEGRPDGNLGMETISLQPGQTRVFNTDWKYEKLRNDGTNYYGSHLRIAKHFTGSTAEVVDLRVRYGPGNEGSKRLSQGGHLETKCDLMQVTCVRK